MSREIVADGSLIARYPGYGAAIAGIVLVLADDDMALAVWDAAMTGARRHGSLYSICSTNIFRGWTWLQRGELAEAEASLRDAHEQLHELFDPDSHSVAYGAGHLARVLPSEATSPARGPLSPLAGTRTRHPTPMRSFAAPSSSCCSPSTAGMRRSRRR